MTDSKLMTPRDVINKWIENHPECLKDIQDLFEHDARLDDLKWKAHEPESYFFHREKRK